MINNQYKSAGYITLDKLFQRIYEYYPTECEYGTADWKKRNDLRNRMINDREPIKNKAFYRDIKYMARDYAIVDWTEKTSCCYELKILLHKKQALMDDDIKLVTTLGGSRFDLRLFISLLVPVFYLFIEETRYTCATNKWSFETITNFNEEYSKLHKNICRCMINHGYNSISNEVAKIIVPGIQTELKERGTANVFDCLFTDLVSIV